MKIKNPQKPSGLLIKLIAVLVIGSFSAAALFLGYTLVMMLILVPESQNWKPVQGQLVSQSMESSDTRIGADSSDPVVTLKALYSYTVDGTLYEGKRVDFGGLSGDNFSGERKARQREMLMTTPLTVYVDPLNPANSVIDRSLPAEIALFITFFLIFPCGVATLWMIATILWPFRPLRKMMAPVAGIVHGGPAIWLLYYYHQDYGLIGKAILALISLLFFAGIYYLINHHKLREVATQEPQQRGIR